MLVFLTILIGVASAFNVPQLLPAKCFVNQVEETCQHSWECESLCCDPDAKRCAGFDFNGKCDNNIDCSDDMIERSYIGQMAVRLLDNSNSNEQTDSS